MFVSQLHWQSSRMRSQESQEEDPIIVGERSASIVSQEHCSQAGTVSEVYA